MTITEIMMMAIILLMCGAGTLWLYIDICKQAKLYEENNNDNDGEEK